MEMVEEWTTRSWQVLELHCELDTNSIGVCGSRDGALDVALGVGRIEEWLLREGSSVDLSNWVVLDDGRITTNASYRRGGGLGAGKGEKCGREDRDDG